MYNCSVEGMDTAVEINGYDTISCSTGEDLKRAIWKYGPVTAHVNIYEGFQYYNGGIFNGSARSAGRIVGHHAVVVTGYGPGYIYLRNSWGVTWGEHGDGRVSDRNSRESGGIIGSVERVSVIGLDYNISSEDSEDSEESNESSSELDLSSAFRAIPIFSFVSVAILSLLQL